MDVSINISISGKNEIAREGLRLILTKEALKVHSVVGDPSAISAEEGATENHLIIVDAISDADGLESCRSLRARFPKSRIVMLADSCEIGPIVDAFDAGVDGYLDKTISCEPLVGALRLIALGIKVVPTQVVDSLPHLYLRPTLTDWDLNSEAVSLSDRELDILRCLVRGETNKIIGRRLAITEATVKVHIKAILRKLNVDNRTQAAIWAVSRGLSDDEPAGAKTSKPSHSVSHQRHGRKQFDPATAGSF